MNDDPHHKSNEPISEQFRIVAKKWVDADTAASFMEETKSAFLADRINDVIGFNLDMAFNKAELAAKASPEYKDFCKQMVEHRGKANLLKVQLEYLRMKFSEWQSAEANARSERRL